MKTIIGILLFGWIIAISYWLGFKSGSERVAQLPSNYDASARVILPVEAFGANWKIKYFRKGIPFPDNFDTAVERTIHNAKNQTISTVITFAPRVYIAHRSIDLTGLTNSTLQGASIRGAMDGPIIIVH